MSDEGAALSGGKVTLRAPVAKRQELQWQTPANSGISGGERREPGAETAPQRQVKVKLAEVEAIAEREMGGS